MSVLSGIGQIPNIFGSGGTTGGLELVYSYTQASILDISTDEIFTIFVTPNLTAGTYLISGGLSFEINDSTTTTQLLQISFDNNNLLPASLDTTATILNNSPSNGKDVYSFNLQVITLYATQPIRCTLLCYQTGNTGGYNVLATNQTDGSVGFGIYQMTNPIV